MFYNNKLQTPLAKASVLKTLSIKANSQGYVQGENFCLYMAALHSGNRTVSKYVFSGHVDSLIQGSVIHFSLRPTMLTILILFINFSLLVKGIVHYITQANNAMFLLISFLVNVLAFFMVIWQEKQCIARFESLFKED